MVEFFIEAEHVGEHADALFESFAVDFEDGGVDAEGFHGGEVPEELLFLAHDECDFAEEICFALPGVEAGDLECPGGGVDESGEHFEGCGFTCTVWT